MKVKDDSVSGGEPRHLLDDFGSRPGFTRTGAAANEGMTLEKFVAVEVGDSMFVQRIFT
ncbi:hypothetical protein D3C78_1826150 [compost metagenome]